MRDKNLPVFTLAELRPDPSRLRPGEGLIRKARESFVFEGDPPRSFISKGEEVVVMAVNADLLLVQEKNYPKVVPHFIPFKEIPRDWYHESVAGKLSRQIAEMAMPFYRNPHDRGFGASTDRYVEVDRYDLTNLQEAVERFRDFHLGPLVEYEQELLQYLEEKLQNKLDPALEDHYLTTMRWRWEDMTEDERMSIELDMRDYGIELPR